MPPNITLLRQYVLQAALRLTSFAELLGKAERGEIPLTEALAQESTLLIYPRDRILEAITEANK